MATTLTLMTLDLIDADPEKRILFYKKLREEKWNRWKDTTTTFYTAWPWPGFTLEKIKEVILQDLKSASDKSKISNWNIVAQIGNDAIYAADNHSKALVKIF